MPAVKKHHKKLCKPRWTYVLPGMFTSKCDDSYGHRSVRIAGYPITAAKIEQLAKWFTDAAAWLRQEGGE